MTNGLACLENINILYPSGTVFILKQTYSSVLVRRTGRGCWVLILGISEREIARIWHRRPVKLEVSRLQLLKYSRGVILGRDPLQCGFVLGPVAADNILKLACVVHVDPVILDALRYSCSLDPLEHFRNHLVHSCIVFFILPPTRKLNEVEGPVFH